MSTPPDALALQSNERYFALTLRLGDTGERMTVAVEGDLDLATVPFLRAALSAAERVDPSEVVIDVGGLEFVGVSGARALHEELARVRSRGRTARLTGESPTVQRLIGLTGELSWLDRHGPPVDRRGSVDGAPPGNAPTDAPALLAHTVRTLVPTACSVGVCGIDDRRWSTFAATDPVAAHLETVQFRRRSGPCVDAALAHKQVVCADLREETRWPSFVSTALGQHVLGVVSFPVPDRSSPNGAPPRRWSAVTIYADSAHSLDEARCADLAAVVQHAASLLTPSTAGATPVGGVR